MKTLYPTLDPEELVNARFASQSKSSYSRLLHCLRKVVGAEIKKKIPMSEMFSNLVIVHMPVIGCNKSASTKSDQVNGSS